MPISSLLVAASVFSLSCGRIGFDPIDGDGGSLSGCPARDPFVCFDQSGPVVGADITVSFSGKLEEFTVNHSPTCGLGSGEYRVEFTNGGDPKTARFRVDSSIDTLIYALDENCAGAELGCENNNDNNASQEALVLNLSAGQTVIIVVEGIAACSDNITIIQDAL